MVSISKKEWFDKPVAAVPDELLELVGGRSFLAQALVRRGLIELPKARAFLDPDLYRPTPGVELPGMQEAVDRLQLTIANDELICVWGDFDVDGQTATSLLYSALLELGARVFYHIPVRSRESHGVNLDVLEQIFDPQKIDQDDPRWPKGSWPAPDLVLTCDTGVSSNEAVSFAREKGVDVLVTDHHDLPEVLPEAVAIVNPKLCPNNHPLRDLPGVGVAFKLIEALYEQLGVIADTSQYLDLVALGIVADVAEQKQDTRYLLQIGFGVLRKAQRTGLRTILEIADVDPAHLSEEHIGFVIGPRLNALGRLSDANLAVELLTTDDPARALTLGYELEKLNSQRQFLTSQVFQAALAQIEASPSLLEYPAIVLSHDAWPAGVIGIVAGKLAERFRQPAILIAITEGGLGRGSARSVEGIDISAAISTCKELLEGYGGHPMAAGLSVRAEIVDEFRIALSAAIMEMGPIPEGVLEIDATIELTSVDEGLVADIEKLAPFGQGNPPLILATQDVSTKSITKVGRDGDHLSLVVEDNAGSEKRLIWWGGGNSVGELPAGRYDIAYIVRSSTFRAKQDIQIEFVDFREVEGGEELPVDTKKIDIIDYRQAANPLAALVTLNEDGDIIVWGEAEACKKLAKMKVVAHRRDELAPTRNLVIWTTPPGSAELRQVLHKVSPETLYLFSDDPKFADLGAFMKRLSGLIKYAIHSYGGQLDLNQLAGLTGQRIPTVRAGIDWLTARGKISVMSDIGDSMTVVEGGTISKERSGDISDLLRDLLEETRAFRSYYSRVPCEFINGLYSEE